MFFLEKVEVIEQYNEKIRSVSRAMSIPAVVRLLHATKKIQYKVRYSRTNIYKRDEYKCLYCGNVFSEKQLTLDHVIPKSMGGRTSWTNVASACMPCNIKKANRTPHQAGMKLILKPFNPTASSHQSKYLNIKEIPSEWQSWIRQ